MSLLLITGASRGLGLEFARLHAKHGGDLIIVSRKKAELLRIKSDLEKEYAVKVYVIDCDLSQKDGAQLLYERVKALGLNIDYLINNAAIGCCGAFTDEDLQDLERLITLDMYSPTILTRLFLKDMKARGHGRILNVASIAALMPGPYMASYYASKAYLASLSKAVNAECQIKSISITTLYPGPLNTTFLKASRLQSSKLASLFTASAEITAKKGYEAMMHGRRQSFCGMKWWLYALMRLVPFIPDLLVLKITANLQKPRLQKK